MCPESTEKTPREEQEHGSSKCTERFCWQCELAELYDDKPFVDQMRALARQKLGSREGVDDVLNDTYLKLRDRRPLPKGSNVRGYVATAVKGTALDYRQSARRAIATRRVVPIEDRDFEDQSSPDLLVSEAAMPRRAQEKLALEFWGKAAKRRGHRALYEAMLRHLAREGLIPLSLYESARKLRCNLRSQCVMGAG